MEYLEADPLKDYKIKRAAYKVEYCPSNAEITAIMQAVENRWDEKQNP